MFTLAGIYQGNCKYDTHRLKLLYHGCPDPSARWTRTASGSDKGGGQYKGLRFCILHKRGVFSWQEEGPKP